MNADVIVSLLSAISTNHCYVAMYLSPSGIGCTKIPQDCNAWGVVEEYCFLEGGT